MSQLCHTCAYEVFVGLNANRQEHRTLRTCGFAGTSESDHELAQAYLLQLATATTGMCPFATDREPLPDSYFAEDLCPLITFNDLLKP